MKKLLLIITILTSLSAMACEENEICSRSRVIHNSTEIGVVLYIFNDGKVKVDWDNIKLPDSLTHLSELSKYTKCFKEFCRGSRIIHNNYSATGTILSVFSNGKIKVDWDNRIYPDSVTDSKDVAKGYRCSGLLCVGEYVAHESNKTGWIMEIFANGKAKVNWEDRVYPDSITFIKQLGYEIGKYHNSTNSQY